jgi:hypothetical protein
MNRPAIPCTVEEGAMDTRHSWRHVRCQVLHMHYWKAFSNPDGERYVVCAVCQTERIGPASPLAPAGAGIMTGI